MKGKKLMCECGYFSGEVPILLDVMVGAKHDEKYDQNITLFRIQVYKFVFSINIEGA